MPDIFVANTKPNIPEKPDVLDQQVKKLNVDTYLDEPNNSIHIFSSFCKNPADVTFQNQDEGEKVLLFLRRANITNVKWVLIGIILLIIPLFFILTKNIIGSPLDILPARYSFIFILFYYLLIATYFYINFITWYFNIAIITDRRIMDVDYTGLVYKNVAATKMNLVQDISYTQIGVARNFFDYGDVLVQTAGTLENFHFESAPQPENIVHIIEDLIGKRYVKP
jgi:hypothetical protein